MKGHLPTIKEMNACFDEYITSISSKLRRRSYSITSANEQLLMTPCPPINQPLKSNSVTIPYKREQSYDFFCKNISNNLVPFITTDISHVSHDMSQLPTVSTFNHDEFDITTRIIPDYYISRDGIKVGALNFNFYNSIIDSIRNMRTLSVNQIAFIDQCSKEQHLEIISEYDKIIHFISDNQLT